MGYLLIYTRKPEPELYHAALANSVQFAYSADGTHFTPLNLNYGILFAKGEVTQQNTIQPKALINPRMCRQADDSVLIQAQRTDAAGNTEDMYLQWTTRDFREFSYRGVIKIPTSMPVPDAPGDMVDIEPGNRLEINDDLGQALLTAWSPLENTQVQVPKLLHVTDALEVSKVRATAVYTDGSACEKQIDWDLTNVDFSRAGDYSISGTVRQLELAFPIEREHGDPVIFHWQGMAYYIYTNDFNDDRGFIVRRAPSVDGLFAAGVEQSLILDVSERFVQTFWAPEFHVIGGGLYILFAVSGKQWGPQCHLMKLKPGGDILRAEDWETPIRVCRRDGSFLAEDAITLDMTHIHAGDRDYVVWSYREHIGTTLDSGSMLYIAEINPRDPSRLQSDPVLLSRPLFGWENIDGTINNEGPHAFVRDDKVYLAFSGGSANGYSYAVGLLTADANEDLLDINNWHKRTMPILHYLSIPGRFGPGHNCFFEYDGQLYIAYHAEYNTTDSPRCAALHRVHFDRGGEPRFDMAPERDLNPSLRTVHTTLRVSPIFKTQQLFQP